MKKVGVIMLAVMSAVLFTACSNPAEEAADTVVGMNDTVSDMETMLGDYKETMGNVDAMGENAMEGDATAPVQTNNTSLDDYKFVYQGVTITPDMNTNEFLDALGEPMHYYEVRAVHLKVWIRFIHIIVLKYPLIPTEQMIWYLTFTSRMTLLQQKKAHISVWLKQMCLHYMVIIMWKEPAYTYIQKVAWNFVLSLMVRR